jgi:hypothetical protein
MLLLACGSATPEAEPTSPPVVEATNTAVPSDTPVPTELPTDTPEPTATDTPEPTATHTPEPTATLDLAATAAFEATEAAAAIMDEIGADFELIGMDPAVGQISWTKPEAVDIRIDGYRSYNWFPVDNDREFSEYVMGVDITWESTGGWAICGLVVRGGPDLTRDKYYLFQTIRLSGLPSWDVELWEFNSWLQTSSGGIVDAPWIDQDNGATNEYLFFVEKDTVTIWANQTRLGRVVISSMDSGTIGYYAWQESGDTTCSFSNAWIWEPNGE